MSKSNKPNANSQALSLEREDFRKALITAGYAECTRKVYLQGFNRFVKRLDRKTPADATVSDAKRLLTELKQRDLSKSVQSGTSAALRFYFEQVRGIEWKPISPLQKRMVEDMCMHNFSVRTQDSYVRSVKMLTRHYGKSPDLITEEEIRSVKHAACITLLYACGLRLSEGCAVKVTDIDRDRMQLRVRGKGSKDRLIPIPPSMMPLLAECWRSHRNPVWLFPFVGRGRANIIRMFILL